MSEEDVFVVYVPRASAASTSDIGGIEWLDYAGRVEALENEPRVLAALEDVDVTGDAGTVLVKQPDGTWAAGTVADPLSVQSLTADNRFGPVTLMDYRSGLSVQQHQTYPHIAIIQPLYGTSANTIAEGNHAHALPTTTRQPIAPQGYMSSGTRDLGSLNVTLPAGKTCKVEAFLKIQMRGADPGPCYYRLAVTIDGNTRMSPSGDQGYWTVQGVPQPNAGWEHERVIAGTGSAITVSASVAWGAGGGGFYTDYGDLKIVVTPNR